MATFHFQLSQNYSFFTNKYHFKKSSQAAQWAPMGHKQPTWHIFCRPATVYASWVNGRYLLQTQIYYCDINYTAHPHSTQTITNSLPYYYYYYYYLFRNLTQQEMVVINVLVIKRPLWNESSFVQWSVFDQASSICASCTVALTKGW